MRSRQESGSKPQIPSCAESLHNQVLCRIYHKCIDNPQQKEHWWWGGAAAWDKGLSQGPWIKAYPWHSCSTRPWPAACWAGDVATPTPAAESQAEQPRAVALVAKLHLRRNGSGERCRQSSGRLRLLSVMWVTEAWGGGGSPGDAWWNQPPSSSGDSWLAFCVRFPHSLVFPDSYLESRSELVSAFFRCEACGGLWRQEKAKKGKCRVSAPAEPPREGGSVVPCVLQPSQGPRRAWGAPATLCCFRGGSVGTVLPGVRTELPTPACGAEAKATPQTVPTVQHDNILHRFKVQFMQTSPHLKNNDISSSVPW